MALKLYTEEQVKKLINGYYDINWIIQDAFDELTPIELPTDEEIEIEAENIFTYSGSIMGFGRGAKWVIEQILNQNK